MSLMSFFIWTVSGVFVGHASYTFTKGFCLLLGTPTSYLISAWRCNPHVGVWPGVAISFYEAVKVML